MADLTLAELKEFLKVDSDALDIPLAGYQAAAEVYLSNAGCVKDYSNSLYRILVTIFCGALLDNPALLGNTGDMGNSGITLNALIAQLRLSQ